MSSPVDQIEGRLHDLSEKWVQSETFLKPAGLTLRRALKIRAKAKRLREQASSLLGLPLLRDLERVHQRVDELERDLERARAQLTRDEELISAMRSELAELHQARALLNEPATTQGKSTTKRKSSSKAQPKAKAKPSSKEKTPK